MNRNHVCIDAVAFLLSLAVAAGAETIQMPPVRPVHRPVSMKRSEGGAVRVCTYNIGWSPDDPAPMKEGIGLRSKADRELFLKEIEPKLRARARLGSRTERMRAPDGALSFDCALPDNAVLFIELSMP